jgi:hypothetical protein
VDWKYARIEEDRNAKIEDMDFMVNSVVGGHTQKRGQVPWKNPQGQSTIAAVIGSNVDPDRPPETVNSFNNLTESEIRGENLF